MTAHRVRSPRGVEGINAFLHLHGKDADWPAEPWYLPETRPGRQIREQVQIPPGGNDVRSYLDVLAPDDCPVAEVEAALTGLWLELVGDEAAAPSTLGPLPNPLVYQRGQVVLRLGVEGFLEGTRAVEMAELLRTLELWLGEWKRAA